MAIRHASPVRLRRVDFLQSHDLACKPGGPFFMTGLSFASMKPPAASPDTLSSAILETIWVAN